MNSDYFLKDLLIGFSINYTYIMCSEITELYL